MNKRKLVCPFMTKKFPNKAWEPDREMVRIATKAIVEKIREAGDTEGNWKFGCDVEYRIELDGYYPHWITTIHAIEK